MNRDFHYQQILERLNGKLDPDLFEACAADLLREIYPTLVPLTGGDDAGMDGAVADGEDEPFPLVTTTRKDVIGNLTKNLKSYLGSKRKRRKVILATSQYLTPRKTQNLYDRAAEYGFTMVNVYHRYPMANLLYHKPHWCKELLNLDGKPSALSRVPMKTRPYINQALIGREKDLKWLMETFGDRLIVGHPGSGKTYLLRAYVESGDALFIISEDIGEIVNAYRSQQPSVIVLDDAQLQLTLISKLRHFRDETGASFSILASSWFADRESVADAMLLADNQIHRIDLLSRDEIVSVIRDAGIAGPNDLIREIVDQVGGRPGLAATLVNLCLQGDVRKVVLGEALSSSVRRFFERRLGKQALEMLAAFSVGGAAGMPLEEVAKYFDVSLLDVKIATVELSAGGIIWETYQGTLAVYPITLRHVLIRDIFFSGAYSLPIHPLLQVVLDLSEAAHTIVGAYVRGARIDWDSLIKIIEQANSTSVWEHFSWKGVKESSWVLENHPELTLDLAHPALEHVPELAVPRLLRLAVGDNRPLNSTPEHPLRILGDWVKSVMPGHEKTVNNRKILAKSTRDWISQGQDIEIGLAGIASAISPVCGDLITDPGAGNTVTIRQTYLLSDEMADVQMLWPDLVEILKERNISNWRSLKDIVQGWAFPQILEVKISNETRDQMRSFAIQMLEDIVKLAKDKQGVLHWVKQICLDAGLDMSVPVRMEPEFETLYPIEHRSRYREVEAAQKKSVRELAQTWSKYPPREIAKNIARIEKEASLSDLRWPRWTTYLCVILSESADEPIEWAKIFINENLSGDLISPFLKKSADIDSPGWSDLVLNSIHNPDIKYAAIEVALITQYTTKELLQEVLNNLDGMDQLIRLLCRGGQLPKETVRKLLQHKDPLIRSSAAIGEWYADPKAEVRKTLIQEWNEAAVRSRDEYFVSLVVENNPDLAYKWLEGFLEGKAKDSYRYTDRFNQVIRTAANALGYEEKIRLLQQTPDIGHMEN